MEKQKILVVDDDGRIRNLLKIYLEKAGFQVSEAENGLEALLALQNSQPNLIVLDIMMPVLDGMETCRQIRKLATTPILLLTARTEVDDKLLGFDCGADDYVEKPFNPQEVVARVRAILRRRSAAAPWRRGPRIRRRRRHHRPPRPRPPSRCRSNAPAPGWARMRAPTEPRRRPARREPRRSRPASARSPVPRRSARRRPPDGSPA